MNLTPNILKYVMEKCNNNPQKMSDMINHLKNFEFRIATLRKEINRLTQLRDIDIRNLEKVIKGIQSECYHPDQSTYSDPTGGYDKTNVCNICGLEL